MHLIWQCDFYINEAVCSYRVVLRLAAFPCYPAVRKLLLLSMGTLHLSFLNILSEVLFNPTADSVCSQG